MSIGFTYRDYINKRKRETSGRPIEEYSAEEVYNLALCYCFGWDIPQNMATAMEYMQRALDMGYAPAHVFFAECYMKGIGVEADQDRAFYHASTAAKSGDKNGTVLLGRLYYLGEAVPKDDAHAFELFKKGAELNSTDGISMLGYMYLRGAGCKKDEALAIKLLTRAAERDSTSAMYALGIVYAYGRGTAKDLERAKLWLARCIARGEENVAEATELLGSVIAEITEKSKNTLTHKYFGFTPCGNPDIDPNRHDNFYTELHKAAIDDPFVDGDEQDYTDGDEYSLYCRSVLLRRRVFDGKSSLGDEGTKKLLAEAIDLLRRASDMGLGAASYALAAVYKAYPTYISDYDYNNANNYLHEFIKLSADRGYAKGLYAYAYLLDTGLGIEQNRTEALYYYYLAYRARSTDGMLVWYYLSDSDRRQAIEVFRAVELENVLACNDPETLIELALVTMSDEMGRDYKTALRILEKAVSLGSASAHYPLAICHATLGNIASALDALTEAANSGHVRAGYEIGHHLIHSVSPTDAPVQLPYNSLSDKHISDTALVAMLERAAEAGITDAARDLGIYYREKNNVERALYWFKAALCGGIRDCAYDIGSIYYRQLGELGNARQYLESIADTNAYAAYDLADIARYTDKDHPRAVLFYEKARTLLAASGQADSYLLKQIDIALADYRAHECPACHAYFSATEKRGLFGVRTVCSECGGKLS